MRLDKPFDFDRYADKLAANVAACERILGRALSNEEANAVALQVGRLEGQLQRRGM